MLLHSDLILIFYDVGIHIFPIGKRSHIKALSKEHESNREDKEAKEDVEPNCTEFFKINQIIFTTWQTCTQYIYGHSTPIYVCEIKCPKN